MKKGFLIIIILLILILPLVNAAIEITSQPASKYGLGEAINIQGSITQQKDFLGKLRMSLICGADSTDMLLKVFNFKTNKKINFDEDLYVFPTKSSSCKIRINIEEENSLVEYKDTQSFSIDSKLKLEVKSNKNKAQLGDNILITGTAKTTNNQEIEGSSTLYLKKSSEVIQILSKPIESGSFSYELSPLFLTAGLYTIEINAQDSFSNSNTAILSLEIVADANIQLVTDKKTFLPQEDIDIKGTITYPLTQIKTDQKITIIFQDRIYITETNDNKFSYTLTTSENIPSGQAKIDVSTTDLYGNKGQAYIEILISSQETSLTIFTDKTELLPEETTNIKVILYDQANSTINKEISVEVEDDLFNKIIKSGESFNLKIPQYTSPGEIAIYAEYENLDAEQIIKVLELKKISTKLNGTQIIIKNIGNVRYQELINFTLVGDQKYFIGKKVNLDPEEEVIFNLIDEELPSNTYNISLQNQTYQLTIPEIDEKLEANRRLILYTTGIILAVLILSILIWLIWMRFHHKTHKKETKKVFSLFQETDEKMQYHKQIAKEQSKRSEKLETGLKHSEEEKRKIKKLFGKYLDPEVTKEIIETGNVMAGEKREITALFLDIRGFTKLSEKTDPWETRRTLNKYFDRISKIVKRNRGSINKYIGDAIFILFNAPTKIENHIRAAIVSAIAIQKEVRILNEKLLQLGRDSIKIGIGINSGEAVIGGFGAGRRLEYTAIGDAVNVASRLEGLAKGGQILITEEVYSKVSEIFAGEFLGKFKVKNKEDPLRVYNITGFKYSQQD